MQSYSVLFIFIFALSIISTLIWEILQEKSNHLFKVTNLVKTIFFYFSIHYGIISAVKTFLGNVDDTLFESFWSAQVYTYVHYGIPMLFFAIIIPIFISKVLKNRAWHFIVIMDSFVFSELIIIFVGGIRLENEIGTFLFILAGIISSVCIFIYKVSDEKDGKKDISLAIWSWGLWVMLTVISIPNEVFLTNINEFPIVFGRFFVSVFCGGLVIGIVGIVGSVMFLTPRIYKVVNLFLLGISIMGYVQSMFFNGQLLPMDGEIQTWPVWQMAINILIWIIVIFAWVYLGIKENGTKIVRIYKGIAIYVIAIQVVSLFVLVISSDISTQKVDEALTIQSALEISKKNNVIVFILDRFDGETMDEILLEDSEFVEPLKDFTYYENATSLFARTSMALPYLLTGTDWVEGMTETEYPSYAYENSDLLQNIVHNGYRVGIYSDISFVDDSVVDCISNYSEEIERKCDMYGTISIMMQCAKYRMAPFLAKEYYSYYTRDIVENIVDYEGIWNVDNDIPFYEMLEQEGIYVVDNNQERGAFLIYHMYGAHPPYRMTEDLRLVDDWESSLLPQAKGSLKILYEYLEQLKALGKYDDATILIIADHGIQIGSNEGDNPIPLILVKEAGKSQSALQINSAPVSQKEFVPTFLEAMGLDRSKYGRTYAEVPENEVNERIHADVWDDDIETYVIKGNAKNPENWYPITE